MIKNHFKIAWRNLRKRKAYSSINIVGLAVGIATSLVIFLVLHYEMSYDDFHSKKGRIYRVATTYTNKSNGEVTGHDAAVPMPLPRTMRNDFAQMEKVAAISSVGGAQIHIPIPGKEIADENKVKVSNGIFFVEPGLFGIFDFNWLDGNAGSLNEPNTAVLNKTLANQFFGDWKKAVGQTIQMWSFRIPFKIVGVFQDLPANTDVEIKMGGSYSTIEKINHDWYVSNDWEHVSWTTECFVLFPKNSNAQQFQPQLNQFVKKYYPSEMEDKQKKVSLAFQPLKDVHLNEDFNTFKSDALTHKELWALALVGFFILFVACINFINLATAQSVSRAKEIGVRKVLGSNRPQILQQFLNETGIISIISILVGYFVAGLTLPFISDLMGKPLSLNLFQNPSILLFLFLLGIIVNFLAGFYPSLVLSGFNPVEAIKNKISARNIGGISVRRGLVVLQFVIAQFLIIGTIVVIMQMQFFRNKPMGFTKNAVSLIELPSDSTDATQYNYLKTEMLKIPGVKASALCMDAPASFNSNNNTFFFDNDAERKDFSVNLQFADTGYLNTFQIKLLAGRQPWASDTSGELMVNETFVKKLGLRSPEELIGKTIAFEEGKKLPVVGIMQDFHSKSLKEEVVPFALTTNSRTYNFIVLRLDPANMQSTLAQMNKVFTKTYPTYIYDLNFLDEKIAQFYKAEAMAAQLFKIAAFLAIFISCLGLYGLVSFMAAQKTKEVGIRKVLGASVQSIVLLFSKEFTILLAIAFLIAMPLGYFLMQEWLSGFYYHIKLSWIVFALAIVISAVIAWLTVGYKAINAGLMNPVKSLKSD